jgi:hypothetical protein
LAKTLKIAKKTSGRDFKYNTRAQFIKEVEGKKPKTLGDLHVAIMISNAAIYVQLSWYKILVITSGPNTQISTKKKTRFDKSEKGKAWIAKGQNQIAINFKLDWDKVGIQR